MTPQPFNVSTVLQNTINSLDDLDRVEGHLEYSQLDNAGVDQFYDIQKSKLDVIRLAQSNMSDLAHTEKTDGYLSKMFRMYDRYESFDDTSLNIYNSERMVEINTYYSKKYTAYIKIIGIIILFCMPIIVISFLKKMGIITPRISLFLILCVIIIGVTYIFQKIHNISNRNNLFFDKFNVKTPAS